MQVQTDLRAGGCCRCGYTFIDLSDWDNHIVLQVTVFGDNESNHRD
jgi:hypothetical protein